MSALVNCVLRDHKQILEAIPEYGRILKSGKGGRQSPAWKIFARRAFVAYSIDGVFNFVANKSL